MVSRMIFIILLLFPYSSKGRALPDGMDGRSAKSVFRHLSVRNGLSQSWVRCIYQDEQGFMWFGASGGLNRYDGYEITSYSLGNVNINAIAGKDKNELWICNDLGVFIYDQLKDSISHFKYLKGQTVLSILTEPDGTVWFGSNTGLYHYNSLTDELVLYSIESLPDKGLSSNYINTLFKDSSGEIWLGTKNGLNRYIRDTDSFMSYQASGKRGSLSGNDVMAICEDHQKRLWVASAKDGTDMLERDSDGSIRFRKVTEGDNIALLVDSRNTLWIGRSSNGGIYQIDLNTFTPDSRTIIRHLQKDYKDPASLSDNSIFCLYEDKQHDVWVGTYGGGVNYFSSRSKKFHTVKAERDYIPALSNNQVNAIAEEERYLWIGTENGIDRFDRIEIRSTHFQYHSNDHTSISSNAVYAVFKDRSGNLWIGTWTGGLNRFDYKTNAFERFAPGSPPGSISCENVFSIREDSENNIWIGTIGGGLNRFDFRTREFTHYRNDPYNQGSLYSDIVHDVIETSTGRILVSAYGSLDILDPGKEGFTHVILSDCRTGELSDAYIICFFEDSRNNIWLGTNKGLALFGEGDSLSRVFTSKDGLSGDAVQAILEDDHGNLWISTGMGLTLFKNGSDVPRIPEFVNFDEDDGLSSNEFNSRSAYENDMGFMFFGSSQGYTYFHPDSISLNMDPPEMAIVEMQLLQVDSEHSTDGKGRVMGINSLDRVTLRYNNSDFTISYSALNYLNPQKNRYKYKLDGYDPEWIYAGNQRSVTYKNLKPGKYTFSVMGSNNDNIWCISPKTLQIIIPTPFWQTLIFRLFIALLLLLAAWGLFSLRLKSIRQEKRKLEILVRNRTKDLEHSNEELVVLLQNLKDTQAKLIQAEKMSALLTLTAGVAHEINNPLNYIAGANLGLQDYFNKYGSKDEEATKFFIESIQTGIDRAVRIVKRLNQFRQDSQKLEEDCNIHSIIENCLVILQPQIKEKVTVRKEYADRPVIVRGNAGMLHQAFSNILINAMHAVSENGEICISTYSQKEDMYIEISDNGCGISEEHLKRIMDPFFTTKSPGEGTGLGLSITYTIIKEHMGELLFESELEKGTRVIVRIPLK